jgi:hypothetical protein
MGRAPTVLISLMFVVSMPQEKRKLADNSAATGLKYLLQKFTTHQLGTSTKGNEGEYVGLGLLALRAYEGSKIEIPDREKMSTCAIENIRKYLLEHVKTATDPGFALWYITFSLHALVKLHNDKPTEEVKGQIEKLINRLEKAQRGGAWSHWVYKSSFFSAACLISLLEARGAGFKVSDKVIQSGVDYIKGARKPSGTYSYPGKKGDRSSEVGSCARSPACELALFLAGESDQKKLQWVVANFFKYQHELEKVRKAKTTKEDGFHVGSDGIAPYYFFFGHFWVSQVLHYVDNKASIDAKSPEECAILLKDLMVASQESNGSWVASAYEDPCYCTATALLVMSGKKFISCK